MGKNIKNHLPDLTHIQDPVRVEDNDPDQIKVNNDPPNPVKVNNDHPNPVKVIDNHPNPVKVNDDHPNPVKVNDENLDPVNVDEIHPSLVNVDESLHNPVNMDENHPPPVNVDENLHNSVNVNDNQPPLVNVDENLPNPVNVDENLPNPVNVDEKYPPPINVDENLPNSVNEDDSHPNLVNVNSNHPNSDDVHESRLDLASIFGIIPTGKEFNTAFRREFWERPNKTRPLLLAATLGRTGNQLFQHIASYCVALKTNRTPTLGKQSGLFNLFPYLSAKKIERKLDPDTMHQDFRMWNEVAEPGFSTYNTKIIEQVKKSNNTFLHGYFQSWKYFTGCENIIKQELTFNFTMQNEVNLLMRKFAVDYMRGKDIVFEDIAFIAIHVRLGDMFDKYYMDMGYTHAPPSYIQHAIEYYHKRFKWPLFIAASEDIQWCKDNINSTRNNVYFSPHQKEEFVLDFIMLSSCNHSLVTVGTYGWWSAWLAGGEVVYYDGFPWKGSSMWRECKFEDRYPSNWVSMT